MYRRAGPYQYKHITATTSQAAIASGPTDLHSIYVGNAGTTWAVTLYDDTVASGSNVIAVFTAAVGNVILDAHLNKGLSYSATGTAGDLVLTFS